MVGYCRFVSVRLPNRIPLSRLEIYLGNTPIADITIFEALFDIFETPAGSFVSGQTASVLIRTTFKNEIS
jgi:hypothetical protein